MRNATEIMKFADADPERMAAARALIERQLAHLVRLIDDLLDLLPNAIHRPAHALVLAVLLLIGQIVHDLLARQVCGGSPHGPLYGRCAGAQRSR
jgi:hypothetical protein